MARPRRSQKTREELLDYGIEVLTEQGYHGTGLKEVLDFRKVPKGSFYNYFRSKEDFGAEVIRHYSRGVDKLLDTALADEEDALSALLQFFRLIADQHEKKRLGCLVGNLGAELDGGYELIRQAMVQALNGWRDRFESALARAQEQGTVRDDLSPGALADFLLNSFEGALIRMRIEQRTSPLRTFTELTLNDFFAPR